MAENLQLAKRLNQIAIAFSIIVLLLVGMMRRVKIQVPESWDFSMLPGFHALINAITALVLIAALLFIKQKKVHLHRTAIYVAMALSLVFLLSYVLYHFTTPETLFGDLNKDGQLSPLELSEAGSSRSIYLVLLLSHIALAAVSLPLILFTFIKAYTNQIEKHRRMAKWVYPIWLYVAVTGPIVYWMLEPYY